MNNAQGADRYSVPNTKRLLITILLYTSMSLCGLIVLYLVSGRTSLLRFSIGEVTLAVGYICVSYFGVTSESVTLISTFLAAVLYVIDRYCSDNSVWNKA